MSKRDWTRQRRVKPKRAKKTVYEKDLVDKTISTLLDNPLQLKETEKQRLLFKGQEGCYTCICRVFSISSVRSNTLIYRATVANSQNEIS
jgi:hypothetical protein